MTVLQVGTLPDKEVLVLVKAADDDCKIVQIFTAGKHFEKRKKNYELHVHEVRSGKNECIKVAPHAEPSCALEREHCCVERSLHESS